MKPNLLATKLYQPSASSKRIERPHLAHRLTAGLEAGRRLSLISAPAGFGKTTCASEWVGGARRPAAWLSLDPSDDNPERFFLYFVAALQSVDQSLGREVEDLLNTWHLPPAASILAVLLADLLRVDRPFLIILDDFHVIQDRMILSVLERLIANQPPQLHFVLVTREDPLLPLARLRANDQITEIRAEDLRFTRGEAERFLNDQMGLALSAEDIAALEDRTEGWVAGLQLAALALQTAAQSPTAVSSLANSAKFIAMLSGNHRRILGYLTEEVLSRQSEEVQTFLLQTSILDKLSGELCDAVTERADSGALLERLLGANLFLVSLDNEQRWYRYHHLFADLLRSQQRRLPPGIVTSLHQRASRWYEQAGMAAEAIEHALAIADYRRGVQLLERHAMRLVMQGYAKTVENWMQAVPPERHTRSPRTNLAFAWMHLLRGNYSQTVAYLKEAEAAISAVASAAESSEGDILTLRAEWSALQSNLLHLQGKAAESIDLARLALRSVPLDNFYIRGLAYLGLGGAYRQAGEFNQSVEAYQQAIHESRAAGNLVSEMLAVTALAQMANQHGQLHFAAAVASQGIERVDAQSLTPPPIMGAVHGSLALSFYEWNLVDQAREQFRRGAQLSALSGHNASLISTKIGLARLHQAEGDLTVAARLTQEAVDLLPLGAPAWLKPEVVSQQVRLHLAQNDPLSAELALKQYTRSVPDRVTHPDEPFHIAQLRLGLYRAQETRQRQALEAEIKLADSLIAEAIRGHRKGVALQAILVRALIQSESGNVNASLDDLSQALAWAEPEGYIRIFVDEGPAMARLLATALTNMAQKPRPEYAVQAAYAQKLLATFPAGESISVPAPGPGKIPEVSALTRTAVMLEPLTERELEVLRLIADGLKYEEIASRLVISMNTVRFYIKEIYGKLNVNSRTKAIEVGHRLDLL